MAQSHARKFAAVKVVKQPPRASVALVQKSAFRTKLPRMMRTSEPPHYAKVLFGFHGGEQRHALETRPAQSPQAEASNIANHVRGAYRRTSRASPSYVMLTFAT